MVDEDPTVMSLKAPAQQKFLGECSSIGATFDDLRSNSVFLVADAIGYEASGASKILEPILQSSIENRFSEFDPNPKWSEVIACADAIRKHTPDTVLAVGGGTAIDIAKLANLIAAQPVSPETILECRLDDPNPAPPLIAIPTTAGTGSEATHFSVVYVDGVKHSVAYEQMRPDVVIVDSALTATLPPTVTAHSGLDALCQAIESIWSVRSTERSIMYASEALELTWNNLDTAVNRPTPESREAMAIGAYRAGQAIDLSKTTAPHALSYTLTSSLDIPHGVAVALTLGPVLVYNARVNEADCEDPRGPEAVKERLAIICKTMGASSPEEADVLFRKLIGSVNCPSTLSSMDIEGTALLDQICSQVNSERLSNNPRRLTPVSIRELLETIY